MYVCMKGRQREREIERARANTHTHTHNHRHEGKRYRRESSELGRAQSRVALVLLLLLLLGLALGPEVKAPGESRFVSLHKTFRLFQTSYAARKEQQIIRSKLPGWCDNDATKRQH